MSAAANTNKLTASVAGIRIEKIVVNAEKELLELAGLKALPFISVRVEVELRGVPTAVANALRRVLCDEMRGRCLIAEKPPTTSGTTDPFMLDQFVQNRISMIGLRARIPDDIVRTVRFAIDVRNDTASVMTVYSGDLKVSSGSLGDPIFDPTYEIAIVQPGQVLRVEDIRIEEGFGRDFAAYQVCVRTYLRHLDLKEVPKKETHEEGGKSCDESGFVESSLIANPRHHVVGFTLPIVPDGAAGVDDVKTVLADACRNIKERLRLVQSVLESEASTASSAAPKSGSGVSFTLIDLEAGLSEGILRVKGETHTIGVLLNRSVYESVPDISFCSYLCIQHEGEMRLTVRHSSDVQDIILKATKQAYAMIDTIQRGIAAVVPTVTVLTEPDDAADTAPAAAAATGKIVGTVPAAAAAAKK